MLRRVRRRIKYNIFPFLLSVILLFTFSINSGVFSPKSARAAAIVDDIVIGGAIVSWLSAAGIAIGTSLAGEDTTQEAAAQFIKELCKQYETAKNLATGFVFNQIAGAINDTIIFVDETAVKPAIQFGHDIWGLLSDVTDWCVDTFDLIPNQVVASALYRMTKAYLDDGQPITYYTKAGASAATAKEAFDNLPATSIFEVGQTYTNGNNVNFRCMLDGSYYVWSYDESGQATVIFNQQGTSSTYNTIEYCFGRIDDNATNKTTALYVKRENKTSQALSYYGWVRDDYDAPIEAIFGDSQAAVDGLGKDLLPSLDYENAEEDEAVWVFPDTDVVNIPSTGSLESDVFGGFLDGARDGTLVDAQTNAATRVIAQEGTAPIEPEPDIPTYELPLIGINFPANWSLNLHGIWHYVRTWVSSIASFINWIFGVYSNLPYAMIVPIYATAVIVIVLGIYKRFFM